jgi:hypothetical protein
MNGNRLLGFLPAFPDYSGWATDFSCFLENERERKSHIFLTSIYTNFLFQISFMLRNAQIISVPRYSFISSESDLLFSRSSTQTCDPEVKIPILLKQTLHRSILWVSCPLFCYNVCLNWFTVNHKTFPIRESLYICAN